MDGGGLHPSSEVNQHNALKKGKSFLEFKEKGWRGRGWGGGRGGEGGWSSRWLARDGVWLFVLTHCRRQ